LTPGMIVWDVLKALVKFGGLPMMGRPTTR
jgi:hypothetical protein